MVTFNEQCAYSQPLDPFDILNLFFISYPRCCGITSPSSSTNIGSLLQSVSFSTCQVFHFLLDRYIKICFGRRSYYIFNTWSFRLVCIVLSYSLNCNSQSSPSIPSFSRNQSFIRTLPPQTDLTILASANWILIQYSVYRAHFPIVHKFAEQTEKESTL